MTQPPTPSPPTLITRSPQETLALGELLGKLAPPNSCLALFGNLGAGKTRLTRGIAIGAAVNDPTLVSSPTYVLLNIYPGPKPVHHLDAYRINSELDFEAVGLDELLQSSGLTIIEWPEKIPHLLPLERLDIHIQPGETETDREFTLTPHGPAAKNLAQQLTTAWRTRTDSQFCPGRGTSF